MSGEGKMLETLSDQGSVRVVQDEVRSGPDWWHRHGAKMAVERLDVMNRCLVLAASAASLRISPTAHSASEGWFVEWMIQYAQQQKVEGRIILSTDDLLVAFWLHPPSVEDARIAGRFRAAAFRPGRFIRDNAHLNIPGPGTGDDGDPNISVLIDGGIGAAVEKLLRPKEL